MNKLYVVFLALFVFIACNDVVDTEIVEIDEKYYITGFISPEIDTISVNISRTVPVLNLVVDLDNIEAEKERFTVKNANVQLLPKNGGQVTLTYLEEKNYYFTTTSNFPLVPGETYTLQVEVENDVFSAESTIPLENIDALDEEVTQTTSEFGGIDYRLDLNFNDISGETNYYIIGGYLKDESNFENKLFFELEGFKTDNLGDGDKIGANTSFFPIYTYNENTSESELAKQDLTLQVLNAEQPLYQFARTTYLNDLNESDPFIELGIFPNTFNNEKVTGVFASYRYFEKTIELGNFRSKEKPL